MLGAVVTAGWLVLLAAALRLLSIYREEARPDRIVGLLYHRVVPRERYEGLRGAERIFCAPLDRFTAQLEWLREHGYHFVTLDQLADHLHDALPLPEKPVFVSFDDGCQSVHDLALPVLKSLGVPAAVFVTVDAGAWIFREGEYFERRMTPEEVRACADSGMTIGSHAVTHRGLSEMSRDEAMAELRGSRQVLSAWCGRDVHHFAIPLNFYNRRTLELCREAGYRGVFTSDNGTSNRDTSPYRIKRFIVEGHGDLAAFERSLDPRVIVERRVVSALKRLPPKLLGERIWMPLREALFQGPLGRWLTFAPLRAGLLVAATAALLGFLALTVQVVRGGL